MKKFLLVLLVLVFLAGIGIAGYFGYTQVMQSKAASTTAATGTTLPSTFTNPFVEKPTSGFSKANTTAVVSGLFAEPTPTPYQNPFGSTSSANPAYQNPFEILK